MHCQPPALFVCMHIWGWRFITCTGPILAGDLDGLFLFRVHGVWMCTRTNFVPSVGVRTLGLAAEDLSELAATLLETPHRDAAKSLFDDGSAHLGNTVNPLNKGDGNFCHHSPCLDHVS